VTSGTSAGFARRFAALLYDSLLLAAVLTVYTAIIVFAHGGALTEHGSAPWWYAYRTGEVLVIGAYYVLNWIRSGQTLGMRAWRLRAVSEAGLPLKLGPAILRSIFAVAAWMPLGLGVLWLYLDPDHLAVHDRLSHTRMLHLSRA
jgi:uncharacterized RDD family membrane protein YckC